MLYKDEETNKAYFSNLLVKNYSSFLEELFIILDKYDIDYELIANTRDVWMRDYMPIQKSNGDFVRYIHRPDYLKGYESLRTDPHIASKFLENVIDIPLNLDGGNIVRSQNKIICTDKIFKANDKFIKDKIIDILKASLDISEVIIIPEQPLDMTGHSDGLVRFIDENKVMIAPYNSEDIEFEKSLIVSLLKHGLEIVTLPKKGYFKEKDGAVWIPHINYMQVENLIVVPIVGPKADDEVIEFFEKCFPTCSIETLDSTKVIEQGGALNCISWNIKI